MSDQVVIGYAHDGSVKQPFMECVLATQMTDAGRRLQGTCSATGPYIAQNRNVVAQRFLAQTTADWLWFLDTDIIFAPETMEWLLKAASWPERPIVAGLYFVRLKEGIVSTWTHHRNGDDWVRVEVFTEQLEQLTFCGMGCTMIHRHVLEKMLEKDDLDHGDPWPWFGHDIMHPPTGAERMSEDYVFCQRARDAGFTIWGVPIGLGHIKGQILDFDQYMKERSCPG
jgi:hypothetical protein